MKTDVHLDTIELTVAFCTLRFAIKSIAFIQMKKGILPIWGVL